jgi:hypothetical protein
MDAALIVSERDKPFKPGGVENDLDVVISGHLAVEIANVLGFAAVGGPVQKETADRLETAVLSAIVRAQSK